MNFNELVHQIKTDLKPSILAGIIVGMILGLVTGLLFPAVFYPLSFPFSVVVEVIVGLIAGSLVGVLLCVCYAGFSSLVKLDSLPISVFLYAIIVWLLFTVSLYSYNVTIGIWPTSAALDLCGDLSWALLFLYFRGS